MSKKYRSRSFRIYSEQISKGLGIESFAPKSEKTETAGHVISRTNYTAMVTGKTLTREMFRKVATRFGLHVEDMYYTDGESLCPEDEAIVLLQTRGGLYTDNPLLRELKTAFINGVNAPEVPGYVHALATCSRTDREQIAARIDKAFAKDARTEREFVQSFLNCVRRFGTSEVHVARSDRDTSDLSELQSRCLSVLQDVPQLAALIHQHNHLKCEATADAVNGHIFEADSILRLECLYHCVRGPKTVDGWAEICGAMRRLASLLAPTCMNISTYAAVQEYLFNGRATPADVTTKKPFVARCVVGRIKGLPVAADRMPEPREGFDFVDSVCAPPEPATKGENEILHQFRDVLKRYVNPSGEEHEDVQAALTRQARLHNIFYVVLFAPEQRLSDDQFRTLKDPDRGFPELILLNSSVDAEPRINAQIFDLFTQIYSYFTP